MTITVLTIVVVACLAAIIIAGLSIACWSFLRAYQMEVDARQHDHEIVLERTKKSSKLTTLFTSVGAGLICAACLALFGVSMAYRAHGETLPIGNQVVLVIASNSMADYYSDSYATDIESKKTSAAADHFAMGDICRFQRVEGDEDLVLYDVYGYKSGNYIITHRLMESTPAALVFHGDNNPSNSYEYVQRDAVLYHYTGGKIQAIGAFILYGQSWFGIYSLCGIAATFVVSEIAQAKLRRIHRERLQELVYAK